MIGVGSSVGTIASEREGGHSRKSTKVKRWENIGPSTRSGVTPEVRITSIHHVLTLCPIRTALYLGPCLSLITNRSWKSIGVQDVESHLAQSGSCSVNIFSDQ